MGRFKAGDRQKILAGHPYWIGGHCNSVGEEGEGVYIGRAGKERRGKHLVEVTYDDGGTAELSFKGRELELLPEAEAWVPKVGDRVRGTENPIEYDVEAVNEDGTIDVSCLGFITGDKLNYTGKALSLFEPLPVAKQPAGLTIEAGKFYRTRDGRKVGPMEEHYGTAWDDKEALLKASIDGDSRLFRATSGIHLFEKTNLDLVAEWVEPAAAATDEAAAPPVKFKVGDRVKSSGNSMYEYRVAAVHAETLDVRVIERDGTLGSVFYGTSIDKFSIVDAAPTPSGSAASTSNSFIVARIVNGKPRPNARPRVHTTLDSANQEAARLANRLGDEFAVYQRVSSRTVDAGPVPEGFKPKLAAGWVASGSGIHRVDGAFVGMAFSWGGASQGFWFWANQREQLTPLGRAILRKWIAEAEATQPAAA